MSEQGAPPEAAQQEGAAEAAPTFDPAPLMEGFEGLRGQLDELRGVITQQHEPEPEPEEDPEFDLSWLDQTDPNFDPEDVQRRFGEAVQQAVDRAVRQASGPAQQALERVMANERRSRAIQLVNEFPELADKDTANNVYGGSQDLAQDIASDLGLDGLGLPPQLAQEIVARIGDSPALWRATFLATKASSAAAAEDSEAPEHAHLEGGSGPGPAPSQADLAQSIVASGGGNVLPF